MPDRRFRCEEEYFKTCTSPYLTLPRTSLIIIIALLLLLLLSPSTLPYTTSTLSPTGTHPFQPFPTPAVPNKTKQNKTNETPPAWGNNSSFLLGAGLGPYLLGILSSTPESQTAPCRRSTPTHPLLAGIVRSPC